MPDVMILVGAALAGFVQGTSGFALGLVATAFWASTLPPQITAPLIVLCSIAGQLLTIRASLPGLDLRHAAPMILAGIAGVPIGIALLPLIDTARFGIGVGLLLCVWCPIMLFSRSLPTVHIRSARANLAADALAGAIGGIMGGVAGLSGPAPTLWCTLRGGARDKQRATIQAFLLTIQLVGLVAYAATGFLTPTVWHLAAWTVPCVLLPAYCGSVVYRRMNSDTFRRMVLALLALTGLMLVIRGA